MSNYGRFFSSPGAANFPGYPSKQHGMPSGKGRHNEPGPGGAALSPSFGAGSLVPLANAFTANGWLVEVGHMDMTGSASAKTAYYYKDQLNTLRVEMLDGEVRSYSGLPFPLIYMLKHGENPGSLFDSQINPIFPCVLERQRG